MDVQSQYHPLLDQTVTNLSAGATYTGSSVDITDYSYLLVMVLADQSHDVTVEQSGDGTNFDQVDTISARAANTKTAIAPFPVVGLKGRLKVKNNGGVSTTTLRAFLFGRVI